MKKIILTIILIIAPIHINAYNQILFEPLRAAVFEPRVGAFYQFDDEKLRLDIGTTIDLAEFKSEDCTMRIGGDFMTYTRLRTEGNFKFPVETSDYFFGVNTSFKFKFFDKEIETRTRLAHISSHLVDGMSKRDTFSRSPFIYSREFIDFTAAVRFGGMRAYGGLTYIFSTRPISVNKFVPQLGVEYKYELLPSIEIDCAYDFKLSGNKGIGSGANAAQLGIYFKTSHNTGLLLSYYLYSGKSMHGMYYDEYDKYSGVGFQLIF